jgi:hypothetical protein
MHTKNEGELKIFIFNFAHFSHALALNNIFKVASLTLLLAHGAKAIK